MKFHPHDARFSLLLKEFHEFSCLDRVQTAVWLNFGAGLGWTVAFGAVWGNVVKTEIWR
jgi:hypothetical protein